MIDEAFTDLFKQSRVEDVVVTEVRVGTGHAGITLEGSVVVQTTNDGGFGRIRTRLGSLATDTQEIGEGVAVEDVSGVGRGAGETALHVES